MEYSQISSILNGQATPEDLALLENLGYRFEIKDGKVQRIITPEDIRKDG